VAIVLLVTTIVQVGVLNGLVVDGAHPDAFLLLAIVAGLVAGSQRGAVVAFFVGLVADLFVLTPFGLSSLCYVLVAFGVGAVASLPAGRAPYGFRIVTAFTGGIAGSLLFDGIGALLGQPELPRHQLIVVVAVVAVANVVLVIPAAAAMTWALSADSAGRELATTSGGSAR
jgi:rod shape-determining protein MreD